MADRNENGIVNDASVNDENHFEQELLEPNFDVNIPFPRNRMPNAQPEPVGRYYLGEWSRAEREYRLNSRDPPYRPPVPPRQVEHEIPQAESENRPPAEMQEGAAQEAGAGRSVSPVPPLPFEPEELLDEELQDAEYEEDLALAMDNIDMLNNMNDGRIRRPLFDLEPLANERDFSFSSQPQDINDSYSP